MDETRPRIAVLDDESAVRKAFERLMQSSGMSVKGFASGAEFIAGMQSDTWDCLILDLHMPGVNGFEVQEWLKASGSPLPVIIITGHDTPSARARAVAGGACAYLLKPVDEKSLLGAIAEALRAGRAR
ncbi:MAG: response regulator [Chitinophagaceae bacterium]|nr:response regulator [Rubrivivax sp.]